MINSYVHALILSMFRVIGSYIILMCNCFQFIACFFYKFCFVLVVFVDLTSLVMFLSVFKRIQKSIKNEKSPKSLIACVVYITCEFGLVPSY